MNDTIAHLNNTLNQIRIEIRHAVCPVLLEKLILEHCDVSDRLLNVLETR